MTDTTINYLSNHPMEQKLATYRYHIERMLRLPLNRTRQLREWKTILHIATSNNFPTTLLQKLKQHKINKLGMHVHHRDRSAAAAIFANGTYFPDNLRKYNDLHIENSTTAKNEPLSKYIPNFIFEFPCIISL